MKQIFGGKFSHFISQGFEVKELQNELSSATWAHVTTGTYEATFANDLKGIIVSPNHQTTAFRDSSSMPYGLYVSQTAPNKVTVSTFDENGNLADNLLENKFIEIYAFPLL